MLLVGGVRMLKVKHLHLGISLVLVWEWRGRGGVIAEASGRWWGDGGTGASFG